MSVSVVIHTCDESAYIENCLKSVDWVDEIVIIDMESTDDTVEKCRKYTDNIFTHPRLPTADSARNFGLSKAKCDWILALDPDERVSEPLRDLLRSLPDDSDTAGYILPFTTWIFGKEIKHTGWGGDEHLRFFKQGAVNYPGHVHLKPLINGKVKTITRSQGCIIHFNYDTIFQFIEKMNRYTGLEAVRLRELNRPFHWLKLFYQPSKEFFSRYVSSKGYKDGLVGFILSALQSIYVQVSYIKLWELYEAEKKEN